MNETLPKIHSPSGQSLCSQIDAIVYQLYGLTAEEIALVEAATAKE